MNVYGRLQVETLEMFAGRLASLKLSSLGGSQQEKEVCFILLQLTNALKYLQAQGIEELPTSKVKSCRNRFFLLIQYKLYIFSYHFLQVVLMR